MEHIIELNGIHFNYGTFKAIDDISLKIGQGIYGLLGPNGAGKTTLMKIILGFLTPQKGNGSVLGYEILQNPIKMRQKIGYMPETDCIIPGMDAVTLTSYLGQLSGMPKQEAIKRAHEVLYYVGLDESRYRQVETYSTGMKQRLKLATAIVHDPVLVFLDEPTSGMDPQARKEMLALIKDITAKGTMNMIISSHIMADIENTCQTVLIMNKGKILSIEPLNLKAKNHFNTYELKLKGDIDSFKKQLPQVKMDGDDRGGYSIYLPENFQQSLLFKVAMETGVQIRHFRPTRVTLEDTFVSVIGETNAH